jgi:hypothetical protein
MTLIRGFCNSGQYLTTFSMYAVSDMDFAGKSSITDKWTDTLELKLQIKEFSVLN